MATAERRRPLDVAVRKAQAIELRIAGHTQDEVATKLGVSQQRISVIEHEWLASRQPSSEVTEARRQLQLAGIDQVRARLMAALDDDLGQPRVEIVDRINKLWEREARLVGLDLQLGVTVNVLTRESLADVLYADEPVIEGVAVEIEANTDA